MRLNDAVHAVTGEVFRDGWSRVRGSMQGLHVAKQTQLTRAAAGHRPAVFKAIRGGGTHTKSQLANQLDYLTTKSTHIVDSSGFLDGKAKLEAGDIKDLTERFAKRWDAGFKPKLGQTTHMLMSFPVGTRGEDVRDIATDVAERFFQTDEGHFDYIIAVHEDRDHPHAHLVLNRRSQEGEFFFLGRNHRFNYDDFRLAMVEEAEKYGVRLEATRELPVRLGSADVDVVFNIAEGFSGKSREAQVPALLELMGIPYTGSEPAALAITLDKALAKRLVREAGVATARSIMLAATDAMPENLRYPVIVKPNLEGSSKGVTRASAARNADELEALLGKLRQKFSSPLLVEEFLPGREFTVGVLGDVEPRVLPIMEVLFDESCGDLPIYSYEHKTGEDTGATFQVPAALDEVLLAKIQRAALGCFEALGCRDVARVDFRLDADGEPNFIECNPLPGLSPGFSDLCVIAQSVGMDHAALIGAILAPAVRRMKNQRVEEVAS